MTVNKRIAAERPHLCTGCGTSQRLSHSHLIPKSYRKDLEAVPENITYHCMSMGHTIGCHEQWEGMRGPLLLDFIPNMEYVYKTDLTYFWKKLFKLREFWNKFPMENEDAFKANASMTGLILRLNA